MTEWQTDPAFLNAVEPVFLHEGTFSNDPADAGGATMYGISLRFLQKLGDLDGDGWLDGDLDHDGDVDVDDIRAITRERASALYFSQFWSRYNYHRFSRSVGAKVFDLSVNMGPGNAHKILQRAVRATGGRILMDDGRIGPKTIAAVNVTQPEYLVVAMRSEAAGFYRLLVESNATLGKFLNGWLNRAYY